MWDPRRLSELSLYEARTRASFRLARVGRVTYQTAHPAGPFQVMTSRPDETRRRGGNSILCSRLAGWQPQERPDPLGSGYAHQKD